MFDVDLYITDIESHILTTATEPIAEALKAARTRKGLSQRALSALSGVPQAHISKIEQNAVDLRLTSLLALAHALDLDLALVPKRAMPAVQSITRATTSRISAASSKEWARTLQALQRAQQTLRTPELDRLQDQLAHVSRMLSSDIEPDTLRALRKSIAALRDTSSTKALQDVIRQGQALRNAIVHNVDLKAMVPARPAYRLDEDDDG